MSGSIRTSITALAILLSATIGRSASAADTPVLPVRSPVAVAVDPPALPGPACASCTATPGAPTRPCGKVGCGTCGKGACGSSWLHGHSKPPFETQLCPGACFGYFQPQWRKWDEVCPYPYQGTGVSNAPKPAVPPVTGPLDKLPAKKPGTLPEPRPIETKKPAGSDLPPIPMVPGK